MNEWSGVFLAVMAVSLAVMAAIQIGLIVVGMRVARQVTEAANQLHSELRPLIQRANQIAEDASRVSALAAIQAERLDQLVATTSARLDSTMGVIQNVMSGPVGQTAAVATAFRAAFNAFRGWKGRRQQAHPDDDDALFVG